MKCGTPEVWAYPAQHVSQIVSKIISFGISEYSNQEYELVISKPTPIFLLLLLLYFDEDKRKSQLWNE